MDFSEQIKKLRKENNLTQEDMANTLHVTRQAISNWENNRNLPDIEMLIEISKIFNISLDDLILGNMQDKLIKDGSENRRAKYNFIGLCISSISIVLFILLLFIESVSVSYIDENGILHESFFLIVIAFLLFFISIIINIIIFIKNIKNKYIFFVCGGILCIQVGFVLLLMYANGNYSTLLIGCICMLLGLISVLYSLISYIRR